MKYKSIACPKCGAPASVKDVVMNTDANEQYRKKECTECGHVFFTLEFEVEADDCLLENWYAHHRETARRRKNKELYGKTKKPKVEK